MWRYLLHRMGRTLAVLVAVTAALYVSVELQPGDVELAVCGERGCPAAVSPQLAQTYAFEEPVPARAWAFVQAAATFDFGPSLDTGRASATVVSGDWRASARLVSVAFGLELLFLTIVAFVNALPARPWPDTIGLVFSVGALAVPVFWLGLVLRATFGRSLVAAALALAFAGIGFGIRQMQERVRSGLDASHVRLARTYGVPERRIAARHGLRPAIPRALESLAGSAGVVLGGLVLLEPVFSRAGIGSETAAALARRDLPVVLAGVYLMLLAFVIARSALLFLSRMAEPPRADRWARS